MTVDLLTLSIALNLANVLQCMALVGLAVANRERAGLRWWAAGMGMLALGLILTTMRDVVSLPLWIHAISNAMVGNGMLMFYYGVCRFFGDDEDNLRRLVLIGSLILIANVVLALAGDIPPLRRILFSVVVAILSLLIAIRLYQELHSDRRTIVLFLVVVFIVNSIFFVLRG